MVRYLLSLLVLLSPTLVYAYDLKTLPCSHDRNSYTVTVPIDITNVSSQTWKSPWTGTLTRTSYSRTGSPPGIIGTNLSLQLVTVDNVGKKVTYKLIHQIGPGTYKLDITGQFVLAGGATQTGVASCNFSY